MVVNDYKTLCAMILPDDVERSFNDFKAKEKALADLEEMRVKALEIAFKEVKPVFGEFIYCGEHLSDLDFHVGTPITTTQEMVYATEEVQKEFNRVYMREIMNIVPNAKRHGYSCPYSIAHQLYRIASNNLLKLLEPFSGVKAEKLSYSEKVSYLSFISSFLSMKFKTVY